MGRGSHGKGGRETRHQEKERTHGAYADLLMLLVSHRSGSGMAGALQHPLAAGHGPTAAGIDLHRLVEGTGERLETGLDDVVGIHPRQLADVEGEAGVVGHRHEEFPHQFGVVGADALGRNRQVIAEVGATGAVEGHLHQGLIEGGEEVAEATDAAAVGEGLGQGLAQGDAHVLVGVVVVDVGVAAGGDLQIQQAVAGDLVEHVVEERHAGGHLSAAGAVKIEGHVHIGFTGDPMDLAGALGAGAWRAGGHASEGNGPNLNHAKAPGAVLRQAGGPMTVRWAHGVQRYGAGRPGVVG